MKSLRTICISFFVIASSIMLLSNSAQPGVWNAGGGGYHLLFPEDSLSFKKIQMQSEKISIQLYPGFAVVKGAYQMKNHTKDTLHIKVGYPVHGIYAGNDFGKLNQVIFDGLYKIKTLQNNKELPIIVKPIHEHQPKTQTFKEDNWYVWENTFLPNSITNIEVYFLVNTNSAKITRGYDKNEVNAFIYLLESGSVWKQPIEKAEFLIELKDGLTITDLQGISDFNWSYFSDKNKTILTAQKKDFSPTPKTNLVITYGEKLENFTFKEIIADYQHYFDEVEKFSTTKLSTNFKPYEAKDPYEVTGYFGLLLLIPFVVIGFLVILIIYFLVRLLKKNRK